MITMIEGRIGGGKTYHAVFQMMKYLASGGCVFTNISLKPDGIRKYLRLTYNWDLQDGQLNVLEDKAIYLLHRAVRPGTREKPVLAVVDEAHIWFNARDWQDANREFLLFMTQSRKMFVDVVFISQSMENVDKQLRRLVGGIYRYKDLSTLEVPGLGIKYPFPQFLERQYDETGRVLVRWELHLKDRGIYDCYDSYALARSFPMLEGRTDFRGAGKIKRRMGPKMKGALILILVCIGIVGVHVHRVRAAAESRRAPAATVVSVPAGPSLPPPPPADPEVKITGYVDDGQLARAWDSEGRLYCPGRVCWKGRVIGVHPMVIWGVDAHGEKWQIIGK